ncbi:unnamed protein product [Vitrella brassicaformis CCMP3155]|uniref:Uncharacterized protein n=1 Tax=Vitrella brassicaformis (strain CCMP3155) TaxID=1169540 RepID=A0A0G4F895_VITBC|nr:unnamed protein product [Vitrella brassicaformis CCMP3155]|eukprot:CEM08583.1 unnamed protein product [Vitrella brassicaformis CCMP3155]
MLAKLALFLLSSQTEQPIASATVLQKVKGFGIGGSARPQRSGLSESGEGFSATANETESSADPSRAQALGTLFKSEDEEIRELGSDEFLDTMRLWAPMSNFVVNEGNASSREEGNATRLVLQQMAEWKPPRSGSYLGKTPDWRFGAPVGAFKGGQLDAVACLEISESDGVVVRYIVLNPLNIGVEGNAADWLIKGMAFICRERLGMRLDIYPLMRVYDGRYYDAHKHLCEQNEVERTSL